MFVCVLLCMCSTFLCKMYCKHILSSPCQWSARPRWWCWRPSSTASQTPPAGPLCRATCARTEVLLKSKHRFSVQIAQQLHPLPLNPGLETFPSFVIRARISHCQIWKSRRCQIWIAFHVFRFNWLAAENAARLGISQVHLFAKTGSTAPSSHLGSDNFEHLTLSSLGAYCNDL